ncbi:MAG: glucose-1-phosphate cytidylyltransferase [Rhodospirillales bacterium]|nr:glucose-1-phosphate cytidylyltransferase [Rhodospirillales bacterium]
MKVVLLAGGLGTRLAEETGLRPKPMVAIGGKPILWHIMKLYSAQGFHDFVICLGYKGYVIKEFFANYLLHVADVTFDFAKGGQMDVHEHGLEPWRVTLVDTGTDTQTGGRLKRIARYLDNETFLVTYGDGLADVDLKALMAFHKAHGKAATVTAVQPPGRFGALVMEADGTVRRFQEKPSGDGGWINGGFFVFEPQVLARIEAEATVLEREPLESLAKDGQLRAYRHDGFWAAMDTLRDKTHLENLWSSGRPPWKIWT